MLESKWTREVCKELEELGAKVVAFVAQKMQEPGIPDRYICHRFWRGFLEFKGATTRLQTNQRMFISAINLRGGNAFVVRYPGFVEDVRGTVLGKFDDGTELLLLLVKLSD